MPLTRVVFVSCLGMLLSLLAGMAYSQTTFASITGTVTDPLARSCPPHPSLRRMSNQYQDQRQSNEAGATPSRSSTKEPTRCAPRPPASRPWSWITWCWRRATYGAWI